MVVQKAVCIQNRNSFSEDGGLKPKATSLSSVESTWKIILSFQIKIYLFLLGGKGKGEEAGAGDSLNYYISEVLRICCCMLMPGFKLSDTVLFSACDRM